VETQVLIIGAGVTGAGLSRDLALRGVANLVVEQADINAGASGANHGLLHSGARYVSNDPVSARQCKDESRLLKRLAPECIEDTGGLFVAIAGDDENYLAEFPGLCAEQGIRIRELQPQEALDLEPSLTKDIIAAYLVKDAAINPFRLTLENLDQAEALGARLLRHTRVVRFELRGGRISRVLLRQRGVEHDVAVKAEQVINATGAWAKNIAALAGLDLPLVCSKGTLLVSQPRITRRVINRLRPPADGDIVTPAGTVSLIGTTSVRLAEPEPCDPTINEVDFLVSEAARIIPSLAEARYIRAFAGVRPLLFQGEAAEKDRQLSRGFLVLDHAAEGVNNFVTVTGGKLTTFRLMAEKTADLVCERLGVSAPCITKKVPLQPRKARQWTEAGKPARKWLQGGDSNDLLLCECEMVPRSAVDQILADLVAQGVPFDLSDIALRSRVGKGSCQGAFCGLRLAAYLSEKKVADFRSTELLSRFLEERWHGLRPVLWGTQLAQEELQEALHCGLFGLELESP